MQSAPSKQAQPAVHINLPGSSGQRWTHSLQRSRNCGSPWYAVSTTEEKENIILGHTCKSGLCATQEMPVLYLAPVWSQLESGVLFEAPL